MAPRPTDVYVLMENIWNDVRMLQEKSAQFMSECLSTDKSFN